MVAAIAALVIGQKVMAEGLDGKKIQILPAPGSKGVVTFFVLAGCPNAQAYAPEMNRIAKKYGPEGWKFYLAYAESLYSIKVLQKNSKEFGYIFPSILGQGEIRSRSHATISPEVAVFAPSGTLLYNGRIDDRFYALGKSRLEPQVRDLRLTLDAIDAGKPAPRAHTEAVGCILPID
ncbi:MAG TPA: hypothetical protein VHE55_10680 [Fimbriimonadaceae bacterium]|nr:hypothetical protein [Fimbriimonadaceae bacterium]